MGSLLVASRLDRFALALLLLVAVAGGWAAREAAAEPCDPPTLSQPIHERWGTVAAAEMGEAPCRGAHAAQRGPRRQPGGRLTAGGRVGPLQIDRSRKKAVISRYGRPTERIAVGGGLTTQGFQLIYRCGDDCSTQFTFSRRTRRLVDFSTSARGYRTARGTRVGTPGARAVRLERKRVGIGPCGIHVIEHRTRRATLDIAVGGGTSHVRFLFMASRRNHVIPC
jgi:hypothetical protein